MKQETKVKVYQSLYGELKKIPDVENLGYPEKKTNYDFYFDINGMHINFSLMADADLFRMETSKRFPGYTDDQLEEICNQMSQCQGVRVSFFNEQITLRITQPLVGKTDPASAQEIRERVFDFIQFIRENGEILQFRMSHPITNRTETEEQNTVEQSVEEPEPLTEEETKDLKETTADVEITADTSKKEREAMPKGEKEPEIEHKEEITKEAPQTKKDYRQYEEPSTPPAEKVVEKEVSVMDIQKNTASLETDSSEIEAPEEAPEMKEEVSSKVYAMPVAEQMRLMYADMDRVFESRKKQMDYREDTLDKRENLVNSKLDEFAQKSEELKNLLEQWDLRESEYTQRIKALDVRENTIRAREKDLDDRSDFIELMEKEAFQKNAGDLQVEIQEARARSEECEKELEQAGIKLESIASEKRVLEKRIEDVCEEMKKTQLENTELKKELEDTKRIRESERLRIHDLTDANTSMQQELETLSVQMSKTKPEKIKELLEEKGYTDVREADAGINAKKEGVSFRIRPDVCMIRAEKEVRKGAKYRNMLTDWNREDETGIFLAYDKLIVCQLSYADMEDSLISISGKFRQIL